MIAMAPGRQKFAPLDPETRQALEESLLQFGMLQPIVIDQNEDIIDGHHRFQIARKLGIEIVTEMRHETLRKATGTIAMAIIAIEQAKRAEAQS